VRKTKPEDLGRLDIPFRDARLGEMLFRYRARNWPDTLNPQESRQWQAFCAERVTNEAARLEFESGIAEAIERGGAAAEELMATLREYVAALPIEIETA
jgi:exodeoxyribonuclease-1